MTSRSISALLVLVFAFSPLFAVARENRGASGREGTARGVQREEPTTADLASNTAIVNADYQRAGNIGPALVSSATSTYTSWNIAGYNDYPLNADRTRTGSATNN